MLALKPKNARSKRANDKKAPQVVENTKTSLFLRGEKCSQICQLALADLNALKQPHTIKFFKKNQIHPFEDPSSLEFFSEKNDTAHVVYGYTSKKRPHCLTFVRMFDHKILDMLELYIEAESFRTLSQFKNKKVTTGTKPMIAFSGAIFDSPTQNAWTLAKSYFTDFFRGGDATAVDVEGLQLLVHFSSSEEVEGQAAPQIHLRVYKLSTRRSGQKMPRVEVEEIGPRIDFRIGRTQHADDAVMREALKKPKQLEPKTKKNIQTDMMGDKIGKVHVGKQDLGGLQTRKMKGLKRGKVDMQDGDDDEFEGLSEGDEVETKRIRR